ncbi:myosin-like coiled-coil protein-domain-containing protein [Dipodascopsis uninucleata]
MKRHEREHMRARKRAEQLQKDNEAIKAEARKTGSVKERLENLCRELQKENKRMKEESNNFVQSEMEKRAALTKNFESTIFELTSSLERHAIAAVQDHANRNDHLKKCLKTFFEQYELRDIQFQKLLRFKDLEVQVYMGRYDRQRKRAESESMRAKLLLTQVSTFTQTESELRSQLNIYVEKFKQVEETLNNSNDLFLTFRKEMEQMTKKTKKLEKENKQLAKKAEVMNRNIIEMAEERTKQQKESETNKKRMARLENLCRALQAERIALENRLAEIEGELNDESYEEDENGEFDNEDDYEDEEVLENDLDHKSTDEQGTFPFDIKSIEQALKKYPPHVNCDDACPIHNEHAPGRQEWLKILEEHRRQMKIDSADYKKQMQQSKSVIEN